MIYTLSSMLHNQALLHPAKSAVIDGTRKISYEALKHLSSQYAELFLRAGVRRGDRIAVYLHRSIEAAAVLFACWQIGAVAVPINDILKTRQVHYIVSHSEALLLVSDNHLLSTINKPAIECDRILLVDEISLPDHLSAFPTIIDSDLAMIVYTSGSTGLPKGIMLTHRNLLNGAEIVSDYLHISENDIIISVLPFSFDYGLNQLLSSILCGGTIVIERSTMPADICNTLLREHVTGLAAVPVLWQQLAHQRSPFIKTIFPHLRYITNTGGRMPEHITKVFRAVHPDVQIYLMFGLTEAFRSTYLPPDQVDKRPTSIGKAIPDVEILVLNQHGKECEAGEIGELVHRGGTISAGYWHDPENTAVRFRADPNDIRKNGIPEILVYSGDYIKKDEEGFLYYIGRIDQMIKSRGMRISPEEIEEYIYSSSLVSHVVAFSTPINDVETQIVAAFVSSDRGGSIEKDLRSFCKRELPEYMCPEIFWQLEEFALTSTGKPDRIAIKQAYLKSRSLEICRV